MKAGAFDFLIKPIVHDVLLGAIHEAIERSREEMHHRATMQALEKRYESLSRREREVMSLVVAGRLNKQVGGELGISEITVKAHRGKLMRKMKAKSFAELVNMALSLGQTARKPASSAGMSHTLAGAGSDFHGLEAGHS
jgi:FixJ family two-component response regulator